MKYFGLEKNILVFIVLHYVSICCCFAYKIPIYFFLSAMLQEMLWQRLFIVELWPLSSDEQIV